MTKRVFVSLLCNILLIVGCVRADYELTCQPPTRWSRILHAQNVSPDMAPHLTAMNAGGVAGDFDAWMNNIFNLEVSSGIFTFSQKKHLGNLQDVCADTHRPMASTPLAADYATIIPVAGINNNFNSVLDVLWRAAKQDWDTPLNKGRRIVIVYASDSPSTAAPGLPVFDATLNCESIEFPPMVDLLAELNSLQIHVVFVIPPLLFPVYQALFAGYSGLVMTPLSADPAELLFSLQNAMNMLYCGATQGPVASTPVTIPPPCTEDAILQLLHIQDISWSYTNDLANMKAKFPDLLNSLATKFFSRVMALASFSDKPFGPVGYPGDYCYREDSVFTADEAVFTAAFDALKILSGRDWKESQYDAILDGIRSASLGWEDADEIDGHQVLRVVMLATDAGPNVAGKLGSLPADNPMCSARDYPSPAALGTVLGDKKVYPIFVVTSDIFNYWVNKAAQVTDDATVLHLSQPPADIFSAIEDALEDICDMDRRRRLSSVS